VKLRDLIRMVFLPSLTADFLPRTSSGAVVWDSTLGSRNWRTGSLDAESTHVALSIRAYSERLVAN